MADEITAVELATRLGVRPSSLRAWLRRESSAGNALLRPHRSGTEWTFSPDVAAALADAYVGKDAVAALGTQEPLLEPPTESAGLAVTSAGKSVPTDDSLGHRTEVDWLGTTVMTLADLLRPGLRAVTVGINPAPASVEAGHYYQGRAGQIFFRRLNTVGLLPEGPGFEDDRAFDAGIGFTDVVKRPTRGEADVTRQELECGKWLLQARLASAAAPLLIFVFKKAATTLIGSFDGHGLLPGAQQLYGARLFVMPGPYERTDLVQQALRELEQHLSTL